jgi:signal transduction histidine kinase
MTTTPITRFAPAERRSAHEIRQESDGVSRLSLLTECLNAIPDAVAVLNAQRQVIFANRALLNIAGTGIAQVLGLRTGEILGCAHASEYEGGCGTTEACRTCGSARATLSGLKGAKDTQECRITRHDGEALDLRVTVSPLALGQEAGVIFAVQDISHEKRRQALERIFFHDILNVAGTVMGYAELLENPAFARETGRIVDVIHRASVRMIDEIKTQQSLLAAENGELTVHPAPLDSLAVLKNVKLFYDEHLVAQDRHIVIAADAQSVIFDCDPLLLERVLGNLVKNALEASHEGDTVTLACGAEGEQVWFEVHNTTSMPRDVQLQVFQRSFSTKGKGRGLGTYSIKLLTERYLRGAASFSSSPEAGTCFRVTYPAQ